MIDDQITLRNATREDMPFLSRLYFDTRRQEVDAWGWPVAQQEWFLRMQFEAQSRSYRASFPGAVDRIVCLEGLPAGRILVGEEHGARHLIDIALLEEHRNRGIGSMLIRRLLQECELQGRSLSLQVLQGNAAIRLYRRLGIVESGTDQMYVQMNWVSARAQERV